MNSSTVTTPSCASSSNSILCSPMSKCTCSHATAPMTDSASEIWLALLIACSRGSLRLPQLPAYSLLTHEQLIDLTWKDSIVPLLLSRYPEPHTRRARPRPRLRLRRLRHSGHRLLSLRRPIVLESHALRALRRLCRQSLSQCAERRRARLRRRRALPLHRRLRRPRRCHQPRRARSSFRSSKSEYGRIVNYAEGEHQHVQTEFAFDIDEIAHHRMAPFSFLRHIGLKVPRSSQLALAYYQTYGLSEDFSWQAPSLSTFANIASPYTPSFRASPTPSRCCIVSHEPPEPDTPEAAELDERSRSCRRRTTTGINTAVNAGIGTYPRRFIFILPKVGAAQDRRRSKGPTEEPKPTTCTASLCRCTSCAACSRVSRRRSRPDHSGDAHASPPPASCSQPPLRSRHSPAIRRPASSAAQSRSRYRPRGAARRLSSDRFHLCRLLHQHRAAAHAAHPSRHQGRHPDLLLRTQPPITTKNDPDNAGPRCRPI